MSLKKYNFKKKYLLILPLLYIIYFCIKVAIPLQFIDTEDAIHAFSSNNYVITHYYDKDCKKYNHCQKDVEFIDKELPKRQPKMPQLRSIFASMDKNQPISFTVNKEKQHIYVFNSPEPHKSQITVYEYDDKDYKKIDVIPLDHPYYKTAFGDYDEENQKVLLGIVGINTTEGDFGGEWVVGTKYIDVAR